VYGKVRLYRQGFPSCAYAVIIYTMKGCESFRPKGVILDMDGLMLETEKPLLPVWFKAGKLFGREIKEKTAMDAIGKTGRDIRLVCMRDLGQDFPYDDFHREFNRLATLEMEKGIALKSGLVVLLDLLSFMNIPFAVATSTKRKWALWKLEKAGILDRFSVIVCGDEVTRGKPAPDIFLAAAEKMGLSPSDCIGFEDSPAGLQGLHSAGIPSIFIKDMIEPPEEILATVWKRCNNLAEAAELFK